MLMGCGRIGLVAARNDVHSTKRISRQPSTVTCCVQRRTSRPAAATPGTRFATFGSHARLNVYGIRIATAMPHWFGAGTLLAGTLLAGTLLIVRARRNTEVRQIRGAGFGRDREPTCRRRSGALQAHAARGGSAMGDSGACGACRAHRPASPYQLRAILALERVPELRPLWHQPAAAIAAGLPCPKRRAPGRAAPAVCARPAPQQRRHPFAEHPRRNYRVRSR